MTQRTKNSLNNINLETMVCERYVNRLLQRELREQPKTSFGTRTRDKCPKSSTNTIFQPSKLTKSENKQSSFSIKNLPNYGEDAESAEEVFKSSKPKQRSKSTAVDREPWSHLLKQQKSNGNVSIFGKFDPLRTLHFLAKELQYQLQTLLPEDNAIQQMVTNIQETLKRVPPEVASTIHLQSALEVMPTQKKSQGTCELPEKLEKAAQTAKKSDENELYIKVMEESTAKLEESCKQMETICTKLKNEKDELENQLQNEKDTATHLKKRIEDLELETNCILHPRIGLLESEKQNIQSELDSVKRQYESQYTASLTEMKTQLSELQNAKTLLDQECTKLKHQLRLSVIEKEKYAAILTVRDRQINEIRQEMTQLQEVVNEQLLELHNSAVRSMPSTPKFPTNVRGGEGRNVATVDCSVSTVYSNESQVREYFSAKDVNSYRDLPSGNITEVSFHDLGDGENSVKEDQQKLLTASTSIDRINKLDSQASIKSMFNEIKKTAYTVASTSRGLVK